MARVEIGLESDGWSVFIDDGEGSGRSYTWNHNDEDMGTSGIKAMLEDLGHEVTVEEWM